jgi:hypothetical protein
LYLEKTGTARSNISSCCLNSTFPVTGEVNFNHQNFQSQRNRISNGEKIPECHQCWEKERLGFTSRRQVLIDEETNYSVDVKLTMLDYNIDPVCNAKCIICSSFYSSAWAAEDYQHNKPILRLVSDTKHNQILNSVSMTDLKQIYFNGGEPLMTEDHVQVLKSVKSTSGLSDTSVSYNTNGSFVPTSTVIELWNDCKSIELYFSIDGTDSVFNYTRYPLKWETILKNINTICAYNLTNLTISISYTVGVHNLLDTTITKDWFNTLKTQHPNIITNFLVHPVNGPLSLINASTELKKIFLLELQKNKQEWATPVQQIIDSNLYTVSDNSVWINYLEIIDQRRKLNWKQELTNLSTALKII